MSMDFNKANTLLQVAKAALEFPQLKSLHDAAVEELNKLVAPAEPETKPATAHAPEKQPEDKPAFTIKDPSK